MKIILYNDNYKNDVKKLLRELQEYVVELDPYEFNVIKRNYEEKCFEADYEKVKNNNGIIYLAIENGKAVGLIVGIIREPLIEYDYERKNNMGEIIELIVSKHTRSNGIGQKLIEKMENYFKNNNCKTINIDVFGYNDIAKKFYFKNGYHTRMITVSKKN